MSNFTPDYRDIDFQTMVARLRTILSNTDSFKDYDFEGANITILMELVSYVGDLNTYFTNKLAQNIHPDTANVYEVVHSLVRQQGHEPSGYTGAELTIDVRVYMEDGSNPPWFQAGDELTVPQWFVIDTGLKTTGGTPIYYTLTEDVTYDVLAADVTAGYCQFSLTFRQGELNYLDGYTGEDIVSNQIVLPFKNWDMSSYPYDESQQSVIVTVGDDDTAWARLNDFFDEVSGLYEEDNAYMLTYDKYERSIISFSNTRNIPALTDPIKVFLLETQGLDGSIASGVWSWDATTNPARYTQNTSTGVVPVDDYILDNVDAVAFITSNNRGAIPVGQYVLQNDTGSVGASNPETMDELKAAGNAAAQAQQRNVTRQDYIGNLERRGDITIANAWGEQEENPDTLILANYNKAYISIIPTGWSELPLPDVSSIKLKQTQITNNFSRNLPVNLYFPIEYITGGNVYNPDFEADLLSYLEPRKMLGIYENFILPELVHFRFDFGLKVKRSYNWNQVKDTVKNKLAYYFQNSNREFGELIDFRDVTEYVLNTGNVSPTDDFDLVRGIQYLIVRDIMTYRDVSITGVGGVADEIGDDFESITDQTYCTDMGGNLIGIAVTTTEGVNNMVGTPRGVYPSLITHTDTGTGSGMTVDITVSGEVVDFVPSPTSTLSGTIDGTYTVNTGDLVPGAVSDNGVNCIIEVTLLSDVITATVEVGAGGTGWEPGDTIIVDVTDMYNSVALTPIGNITGNGTTITVTTDERHGLWVGASVAIDSDSEAWDGDYIVATVTNTTEFTITSATNPADETIGNVRLNGSFILEVLSVTDIIELITVETGGTGYVIGDHIQVDAHYLDGDSGQVDFDVATVTYNDCSLNSDINEMYIYPVNDHNYFPHYVELGYVQNNQDTTYNDLQPIQLGFKQFPQIAIDQCVFQKEG